jgi:chromosome segregation ATPase
MRRIGALLLLTSVTLVAQSADSQTLSSILAEIRQLRQELAGMTIVAQRVQILLYRLQIQRDAVKSAMQRHDQAVAKVKDADQARTNAANGLKAAEEKLASAGNESQRPALEAEAREMKRRVDMWTSEEGDLRAAEISADSELKREQAALADLQQRLDQLEIQLQSYSTPRVQQ